MADKGLGEACFHKPVLPDEVICYLKDVNLDKEKRVFVDATCGTGGHSELLLKHLRVNDILIGLDIDAEILGVAQKRLRGFKNFLSARKNYSELPELLKTLGFDKADAVLADVGANSLHFDRAERGFSFAAVDSPLDMRFDRQACLSAFDVVNSFEVNELSEIIKKFGEEKFSRRIAQAICRIREKDEIRTTGQLAKIVSESIPKKFHPKKINPATKTFQAIRIFVNKELKNIEVLLSEIPEVLSVGGRIGVITFHSLEDRLVKDSFRKYSTVCTCPPEFPVCICGGKQRYKMITRKPVKASEEEIRSNPRSRSAKWRVLERVAL